MTQGCPICSHKASEVIERLSSNKDARARKEEGTPWRGLPELLVEAACWRLGAALEEAHAVPLRKGTLALTPDSLHGAGGLPLGYNSPVLPGCEATPQTVSEKAWCRETGDSACRRSELASTCTEIPLPIPPPPQLQAELGRGVVAQGTSSVCCWRDWGRRSWIQ